MGSLNGSRALESRRVRKWTDEAPEGKLAGLVTATPKHKSAPPRVNGMAQVAEHWRFRL